MILIGLVVGFVAFLLVGMILLQEGKGGGIAAIGGAGMENVVGARNPLRRLTVAFSVIFIFLILLAGYFYNREAHKPIGEGIELPEEAAAVPAVTESVADAVVPVAEPEAPGADAAPAVTDEAAPVPADEADVSATDGAATDAADEAAKANGAPAASGE